MGYATKQMEVREIPLGNIAIGANSRLREDDDQAELMESIQTVGLLQPIGVIDKGLKFELVYGRRRFESYKKLGLKTIPAVILKKGMTEEDVMTVNLQENLSRRGLTPWEEGRYYDWFTSKGLNPSEIGVRVGKKKAHIERCLTIFRELPKEFRDKVAGVERKGTNTTIYGKGMIPATNAADLIRAARSAKLTEKGTKDLCQAALQHELNVKQLAALAEDLRRGKKLREAVKRVSQIRYVSIKVPLTEEGVRSFKDDGISVQEAAIKALRTTPDFRGIIQE